MGGGWRGDDDCTAVVVEDVGDVGGGRVELVCNCGSK